MATCPICGADYQLDELPRRCCGGFVGELIVDQGPTFGARQGLGRESLDTSAWAVVAHMPGKTPCDLYPVVLKIGTADGAQVKLHLTKRGLKRLGEFLLGAHARAEGSGKRKTERSAKA